jgi:murein L,D-transpeptidase YcbB/YkuD
MQRGDQDVRVSSLRKRLLAESPQEHATSLESGFFDAGLDEAVRRFQKRYGLDVDGIVGANTLADLNVSVEERISQIEINMERWRWLPQDLGVRHILVNMANFELDVVEDNRPVIWV